MPLADHAGAGPLLLLVVGDPDAMPAMHGGRAGNLYAALLTLDKPAKQLRGPRPRERDPLYLQLTLQETESLEKAFEKLRDIVLDFIPKAYLPQPEPADTAPGPG